MCADGAYERALAYLKQHFGEQFVFLSRQQVLDAGLLGPGPIYNELQWRLGDIVGIATGNGAFARTAEDAERLPGRHGSLTQEEMLVPVRCASRLLTLLSTWGTMTVVRMLLVGLGNLGRRFCEIVAEREDLLAERYGLRLVLVGAVDSRGLPTTQRGSISGAVALTQA